MQADPGLVILVRTDIRMQTDPGLTILVRTHIRMQTDPGLTIMVVSLRGVINDLYAIITLAFFVACTHV